MAQNSDILANDVIQVGDLGSGELVIVAGSSRGHLNRLRLTSPLAPGSDPSEIQVNIAVLQISTMAWQNSD